MKKFDVEFTYTSEGIVSVEAKDAIEAAAKVQEILKYGLPQREALYLSGSGEVTAVNDLEEESNESKEI